MLNVRRFPPPSSRTYLLPYIGAEAREEGGTRCQRALAAEGDRGAEEIGQQEAAETASGCPKRWCWSKEEQVGRKTRCRAPGTRRGGCHPRGSGGVAAVRQWAGACCHPPGWWRSRERGTRCRLPSTGGAIAGRQEAEGASGRPPKRSSTIAWHREWAAQLVEDRAAVCPVTGPRFFFSSLPSLFSVTPHPSVSFLSPRLSLPPGTPRPPWRAPPGRGGRGGVERSLVGTPRPARGDGVMWRVGRGREPWERSEAGGVIGNERHLHHSPVSSPTEELRKG